MKRKPKRKRARHEQRRRVYPEQRRRVYPEQRRRVYPEQRRRVYPEQRRRVYPEQRRRGGQPGNQNARKHGLYSSRLSIDQICELANILNAGGQDPELIALRIKLISALQSAPNNRRVLNEASKILSKWYLSNYNFGKKDRAFFKAFVRTAFKDMLQNQPFLTERIVAKTSKKTENLTERIEAENLKKISCSAIK